MQAAIVRALIIVAAFVSGGVAVVVLLLLVTSNTPSQRWMKCDVCGQRVYIRVALCPACWEEDQEFERGGAGYE